MIQDCPNFTSAHTNVIVVAGVNDINRDGESADDFLKTMDKGMHLIHHQLMDRGGSTHLTMVAPPLPPDVSVKRQHKAQEYDKMLRGLSNSSDFPFTYLRTESLHIPMDGYHPTDEGTKALLQAIHGLVPIVVNDKYIVSERYYQGVESVYKYGCLYCKEYLALDTNSLCPKCVHLVAPLDNHTSAADVEMEQASNKRMLHEDGDNPSTPAKKSTGDVSSNGDGK